jgi:hypothetical protein
MRRMRFARMVALGGMIAVAGVLAVIAARADELSDQHHPDQALQQKLDLLDHGQDTPYAPPTVDVDKGSFPGSMRIPGTDTSIRVYGSGIETLQYSR